MRHRLGRLIPVLVLLSAAVSAGEAWRVAGPPPDSWQRDRLADLAAHRRAVMDRLGPQAVLVLYAAEPRNYAGDVDWPYRQENDFYYLTALSQPGAALVLVPGAETAREILFLPPSDPAQESWTGHLLTPEEARRISGIQQVFDARRLGEFLRLLAPQAGDLFDLKAAPAPRGSAVPAAPPLPEDTAEKYRAIRERSARGETHIYLLSRGAAEHQREIDLAAKLAAVSPRLPAEDATALVASLRTIKSAREVDLLRHAIDITAEAFERAYALAAPGMPEYEIQAQFEFTFLRRNAHWGYPSIIGSGANATTLHYESNRDTMPPGGLLLMDAAAEFDGYSADVTRTIPLGGRFTREQAQIYRLVWEAQQAAIRMARAGHKTGTGSPRKRAGRGRRGLRARPVPVGLDDRRLERPPAPRLVSARHQPFHRPQRARPQPRRFAARHGGHRRARPLLPSRRPRQPAQNCRKRPVYRRRAPGIREIQGHRRAHRRRRAHHRRRSGGALFGRPLEVGGRRIRHRPPARPTKIRAAAVGPGMPELVIA